MQEQMLDTVSQHFGQVHRTVIPRLSVVIRFAISDDFGEILQLPHLRTAFAILDLWTEALYRPIRDVTGMFHHGHVSTMAWEPSSCF